AENYRAAADPPWRRGALRCGGTARRALFHRGVEQTQEGGEQKLELRLRIGWIEDRKRVEHAAPGPLPQSSARYLDQERERAVPGEAVDLRSEGAEPERPPSELRASVRGVEPGGAPRVDLGALFDPTARSGRIENPPSERMEGERDRRPLLLHPGADRGGLRFAGRSGAGIPHRPPVEPTGPAAMRDREVAVQIDSGGVAAHPTKPAGTQPFLDAGRAVRVGVGDGEQGGPC